MKPDRETTYAGRAGSHAGPTPRPTQGAGTRGGLLRNDRGQAVTEFAMVLPLLALIVFVFISFGKALYVYIQVTHVANEAARLAAVNQPQTTSLPSYLTSEYALPSGTSLSLCYPPDPSDGAARTPGTPVQVVAYTSSSWVPFIGSLIAGGRISGSATMRLEQDTTTNGNLDPVGTC